MKLELEPQDIRLLQEACIATEIDLGERAATVGPEGEKVIAPVRLRLNILADLLGVLLEMEATNEDR